MTRNLNVHYLLICFGLLLLFFLSQPNRSYAQTSPIDSLEEVIQENTDTTKMEAMLELGSYLRGQDPERGI